MDLLLFLKINVLSFFSSMWVASMKKLPNLLYNAKQLFLLLSLMDGMTKV